MARAGHAALYREEPDVVLVRGAIGADLVRRIVISSGDEADAELTELAMITYIGALEWAGAGALGYDEVGARIERVARHFEFAKTAGFTG